MQSFSEHKKKTIVLLLNYTISCFFFRQLTLKFTGHKLIDWIVNPVSKAFTHIFHSKIVRILQSHAQSAIQKNIGKLNQNIARKIHHK